MANPAIKIAAGADRDWLALGRAVKKIIQRKIKAGMEAETAVIEAFKEAGYTQKLSSIAVDGIATAMTTGIDLTVVMNKGNVSRTLLSRFYDPSGVNLSSRIWKNASETQADVSALMRTQWRNNKSWTSAAQNLHDAIPPKADIPKVFKQLDIAGRKAMSGNPTAIKEYRRLLSAAEQQAERLTGIPVSTERLKATYKETIDKIKKAVESKSTEAMDKAINRAMYEKARYNAMRLTRTETARAYWDGFKARILDDDDIVGWRSVLSAGHDVYDICDFYADADLHGMGAGVYPKDISPQLPYHPSCMCVPIPVSRGEVGNLQPDNDAAIEHIQDLSEEERVSLMGRAGAEEFDKDPSAWNNLINGNSEYKENVISDTAKKIYDL